MRHPEHAPRAAGRPRRPGVAARLQQLGLSIIELMVGIAIGLALVALMLQGFASSQATTNTSGLVSEYQTNGRYALEQLRREIRHAALSPLLWEAGQLQVSTAAAGRNFGCGTGMYTGLMQGVQASNSTNPYAASCLATGTDRSWLQGDVLVLRRLALTPATTFTSGVPYARVSYGIGQIFLGQETPPDLAQPRFDHALITDVYFINSFTNAPDETPRVPALYRLTLGPGANPTFVPELVASNVEHMKVEFAVTDSAGNVRYRSPDQVTDWTTVNAVRLWLLVRASEPESGFASGSFAVGTLNYAPQDNFRRVLLSSTINLRNR